jgi:hypothetical protein
LKRGFEDRAVVKAFEALGWQVVRQSSSHIILVQEGPTAFFKLWQEEEAAGRDPKQAFAERGWEP